MNTLALSPFRNANYYDDFDRVMGRFFAPVNRQVVTEDSFKPRMDVVETEQGYKVKTDLPGLNKEDISVSVKDNVLTIQAESVKETSEENSGTVLRQERRAGKYARSLKLGTLIDESAITAAYENGVLILTLPKAEEAQPKKIDIQVH